MTSSTTHLPPPRLMRALRVFASELGLHHVRDSHAPRDIILICLSRFTRLLG